MSPEERQQSNFERAMRREQKYARELKEGLQPALPRTRQHYGLAAAEALARQKAAEKVKLQGRELALQHSARPALAPRPGPALQAARQQDQRAISSAPGPRVGRARDIAYP